MARASRAAQARLGIAAIGVVALLGVHPAADAAQDHRAGHAAAHAFPSDGATDYLPINMSISEDTPPDRFIIVENWFEEL